MTVRSLFRSALASASTDGWSRRSVRAAAGLGLLSLACLACKGETSQAGAASASATATAKAASTATATATAKPAGPPALALFSGEPAFKGGTKPYFFMGVRYDMPSAWKEWNDKNDKLISVFNNPPATVKGKLWLVWEKDLATWATAAAMAERENDRTAKVTQGGKQVGSMTVPSVCERSAFEATNVHHTKQKWDSEPKAATFGADKRPGAVLAAKDEAGKWQLYCLRAAMTDEIGLVGAIGYRTDKPDAEANGAALAEMIKSFRSDGKK